MKPTRIALVTALLTLALPAVASAETFCVHSPADCMQITRNPLETVTGPSDWFTGTVYIDAVATASEPSRLQAASVHFVPGARTAWHTHPFGQTIYVTEGIGRCRRPRGADRGHPPRRPRLLRAGEQHWHGAAPDRFMTHLAMQEVDDQSSPIAWGEHVSDEEYSAAPIS